MDPSKNKTGYQTIISLATDLCPVTINNIKNQYKPYLCTFSSIFSYFYLSQMKLSQDNLLKQATSYCSRLNTVQNAKTQLISNLASLNIDSEVDFVDRCEDLIIDNEDSNVWMDPIIPSSDIQVGPLCQNIYSLLKEMKNQTYEQTEDIENNIDQSQNSSNSSSLANKRIVPFEQYLVKINQLLLLEFMSAIQMKLFQQCSDLKVIQYKPRQYCEEFIEPSIDFWDMEDNLCKSTEFDVKTTLTCESVINPIFTKLHQSLMKTTEDIFNEVAKSQSKILMRDFI
eukprot:403367291